MFRLLLSPAFLFLLLQLCSVSASQASTDNDRVQTILSQAQAPAGVVFEIASADKDTLQWALPRIQRYTTTLREKFPAIEIAIVTHGREQFALQEANADKYRKVHESVKALSTKQDVPVHICQTFAAWNGVEPEEFPDYVTVSATGPQQVNDYIDLGYTLIKIKRK
jgi:intracellular sulfur oxidation DsrE/DsrF family protein